MTRKKKGKPHSEGSGARGAPGPSPLLIIAGLPAATAVAAAATVNNSRPARWRAVATPFPNQDAGFYSETKAILDLGAAACNFAARDIKDANGVRTPSRIVVAYVKGDDSNRLWDLFGHAVWPVQLDHPDWAWLSGRHWRHSIETVNLLLMSKLRELTEGFAESARLRLEARRRDDPLLLPGRNFLLQDGSQLLARFRAFMCGQLALNDIGNGIRTERYSFERLKEFYTRMGGANQKFAVDSRDIVFAKANVGQDGGLPMFDRTANLEAARLQKVLESRYRFGAPLEPAGFQHDVQRESGAQFQQEQFFCVNKGAIRINGDHANIFGSDVVTGHVVG